MDAMGVSTDVLHLPLGILAYLFFAWVLRRRHLGPLWALLPVVALQGLNEVLDARDWWHWTGTVSWTETWIDTVATLALPTAVAASWMTWRKATL
ncbi:hypothetical protein N8390_07805 [Amylibacter sp.]|nr:hypothetical protein [Amylibacter sp.]